MTAYEKILTMWQEYNIKTAQDLNMRLDSFRVLFAYNSGRIENPEITYENTREVFSDGRVTAFSGSAITVVEIANQKLCYEFLLPKIIGKEPITIELIKEIHEITTNATYDDRRFLELGERPGLFKINDFVVGEDEVGSAPEDVEGDLISLLEEINDIGNISEPIKLLKMVAYFHGWFETIHPFADGNGRVGRTLINYMLMSNGHPPLVVYNEDKQGYYNALKQFSSQEKLDPLFEFFQSQLEKTWEKGLKRYESRKDKTMTIRKTTYEDIPAVLEIYAQGREIMAQSGNHAQWQNGHPAQPVVENDISTGNSYVCIQNQKIIAVFYLGLEPEPTYAKIDGAWLNPEETYGVVHRIARAHDAKGAGEFCLNWCFDHIANIRIDTHQDNIPMRRLLEKLGYQHTGIIWIANGDERLAFQKIT